MSQSDTHSLLHQLILKLSQLKKWKVGDNFVERPEIFSQASFGWPLLSMADCHFCFNSHSEAFWLFLNVFIYTFYRTVTWRLLESVKLPYNRGMAIAAAQPYDWGESSYGWGQTVDKCFREKKSYQDCLKMNEMINKKFTAVNFRKWFLQKQKTQEQQLFVWVCSLILPGWACQ